MFPDLLYFIPNIEAKMVMCVNKTGQYIKL